MVKNSQETRGNHCQEEVQVSFLLLTASFEGDNIGFGIAFVSNTAVNRSIIKVAHIVDIGADRLGHSTAVDLADPL